MPRKGPAVRREVAPGPRLSEPARHAAHQQGAAATGRRRVAERTVYKALEVISERTANDPVITLKKAVENVRPHARGEVAAASVAPPTRCRSRSSRNAAPRSRCAGS